MAAERDEGAKEKRLYRKIEVRMWGDERFRALSPMPPSGQGLWFYLLTGPHTSAIPGLFKAGRAAMAEELDWDIEAFDKAFDEAFRQGMVKADWKAKVVWVPKVINCNPPANPNVVKSWRHTWDLLPECDLKREAYESLRAFICELGKPFEEAFGKAIGKPSAKTIGNQQAVNSKQQAVNSKESNPLAPPVEAVPVNNSTALQAAGESEDSNAAQRSLLPADPAVAPTAAAKPINADEDFEFAWSIYPRRAGGNSRADALKAWTARLKQGKHPADMIEGVKRYAAYQTANGNIGTQFVKTASVFFGPGLHFEESWEIPPPTLAPMRAPRPEKFDPFAYTSQTNAQNHTDNRSSGYCQLLANAQIPEESFSCTIDSLVI